MIIITGAGNGIGRAISQSCAAKGFRVHACDIDEEALSNLAKESAGGEVRQVPLDISDYDSAEAFFNSLEVSLFAEIALINNAGVYLGRNLLDYSPADIDRVLSINIKGAVYFSQLFGRLVKNNGLKGRIINISSVAGQEGSSDAVYGLSKAALLGLTKSCALNFAPDILVNAIAPTIVDTKMMKIIPEWRKREYHAQNLISDPLAAEDIAQTVMFLLSGAGSHYTGATFDLNHGGYLR